ncbi:YycH family regulatory protein [Rummeliibacillus pycnus]|uniref:YycH family regulatory protein n=1 Tax=Rummeliibacillus pycnus TaxID=101070 RepID=UPI000C99C7B9|nr:two-component system activity regulator YycH [Rummeliibacillus pycnus]
MGLKYIEQIKSVILFVLVLSSITLTFSIWTYKPHYATIEKTKSVPISVEKKKQLIEVIKPYRMVFHEAGIWRGTDQSEEMDSILQQMQNWQVTNLQLIRTNANSATVDGLIEGDNRFTLLFPDVIPYRIFQGLLSSTEDKIVNMSFNQMIVSWNQLSNTEELTVFFVNTKKNQLFKAKIHVNSAVIFKKQIIEYSHSLEKYAAFKRDNNSALYLPARETKMMQYTYLISTSSIDRFKNALFLKPKIVKNSVDDSNSEENYTDGVSMLTVNSNERVLNFVNTTESDNPVTLEDTKLILNTFDFINEHGGWTGDFRYDSLDNQNNHNKVVYQLYTQDYPVYTDSLVTSTQIETVWGDNQIARYIRPYYKLVSVPENHSLTIMGGQDVVNHLEESNKVDFNNIKEIRPGYYLTKNDRPNVFVLKPSWFYLINGQWMPLSPTTVGGGQVGLE